MSIFVELADNETSGCSGFVCVIGILLTLESIFNGGGKTMQGNMSLSLVMVRRKNRASSTLIESPLYGFYPFFRSLAFLCLGKCVVILFATPRLYVS
jgi:hypothetical protein